jgi:hypothetical protein
MGTITYARSQVRVWQTLVAIGVAALLALVAASTTQSSETTDFAPNVEDLAELIQAANADPETPAAIELEEDAIYLLEGAFSGTDTGLPSIESEISIVGNNTTIKRSTDDEIAHFRIFEVSDVGDLTLEGVTLSNGLVASHGGAIRNHGSLTVIDSVISDNEVFDAGSSIAGGGGIYSDAGATLHIQGSKVTGNIARESGGGGINASGELEVVDSVVSHNIADVNGGGIAPAGDLDSALIETSEIHNNHANQGGGVQTHIGSESFEIADSTIHNNTATLRGGGIFNPSDAEVIVNNSVLRENVAGTDGGGLYSGGLALVAIAEVHLDDVLVQDNEAGGAGGGLSVRGRLSVHNSEVLDNTATDGGGGIYFNPQTSFEFLELTITDSDISGNESKSGGGGVVLLGGNFSMARSTVENNQSEFSGGGISLGANTDGTIIESTINENEAGSNSGGVGVFGVAGDGDATLTLINSTVTDNEAGGSGGGVNIGMRGSAILINNTITGNSAGEFGGGGVSVASGDPLGPGSLEITNSIVADNHAADHEADDIRASGIVSVIDNGHNLVGDGATAEDDLVDGENGNIVGTADDPVDPVLGPLQDNEGPTKTMALLEGSPALEAGNDANAPDTDQRSTERPQGSQSDIGAYEREFTEPEAEPVDMIDFVTEDVDELNVQRSNQLTNPLASAQRHLERNRDRQACHQLNLFIQHAERQTNQRNGLSNEDAAQLIAEAEAIKDAIGC